MKASLFVAAAAAQLLNIYLSAAGVQTPVGQVSYDAATNSTLFSGEMPSSGAACLTTPDLPGHECFTYTNGLDGKQFVLFVDEEIVGVSLVASDEKSPIVRQVAHTAPNFGKPKVAVEENVEAEDNRLFIQKNWMYIVPGLLLVMALVPEQPGEKE